MTARGVSIIGGRTSLWLSFAIAQLAAGLPGQAATATDAKDLRARIEASAKALESDESRSAEAREKLRAAYKKALGSLDASSEWLRRATESKNARAGAPKELESLRIELERPTQERTPPPPWSMSLTEVESRLDVARGELTTVRGRVEQEAKDEVARTERRTSYPSAITKLRERITGLDARIASATTTATDPELEATAFQDEAELLASRAELAAREQERSDETALTEVWALRRRLNERKLNEAQSRVEAWTAAATERRQREARRAKAEAQAAQSFAATAPEGLRVAADKNAELAERIATLAQRAGALGHMQGETKSTLESIRSARAAAQKRETATGLSEAVGVLLRKERAQLTSTPEIERRLATRRDEMAKTRLERIQYEETLQSIARDDAAFATIFQPEPAEVDVETAKQILTSRRVYLSRLIVDCDDVFGKLASLEQDERNVVQEARDFQRYIDERVLWIRSTTRIWDTDFSTVPDAAAWLVARSSWTSVLRSLATELRRSPVLNAMLAILCLVLLLVRRRMKRVIAEAGELAQRSKCMSMRPTWRAGGATLILALGFPTLLGILGWRLTAAPAAPGFARAFGAGLSSVSVLVLVIEATRHCYRRLGLGPTHFAWSESLGAKVKSASATLFAVVAPALCVTMMLEDYGKETWQSSLGRLALVVMLATAGFITFRRITQHRRSERGTIWSQRFWALAQWGSVLVPVSLAASSWAGYHFTTVQLVGRLLLTMFMLVGVATLHGFASRALLITKRKLAIEQAKQRQASRRESGDATDSVDPEILDIATVDSQSKQVLAAACGVATVVFAWVVWSEVLPALNVLDHINMWATTRLNDDGAITNGFVTLGDLLLALTVLAGTLFAVRNLPSVLEVSLLRRLPMGPGERYAVKAVVRYIVILIGIVWVFSSLGVGWSKVQWLAAAVSVGLGFGLQEIFANFVSGLIILGERPVRVGDWVTVGDVVGKVSRIRMRATTLIDRDNCEWLVPNKEFITARVSNWTLSDQTTRVVVPVGVAYGSDTDLATKILLEVARDLPEATREPSPTVLFRSFGDNSLNLELRFYMRGRDNYPAIVTPINSEIHKRFAKAGIEIAFPQRDLHIRSAPGLAPLIADLVPSKPEAT